MTGRLKSTARLADESAPGAQRSPRTELARANLLLEKQRLLWRVAYNLRLADVKRYEHAARELDEIGRRIGAWAKRLSVA